MNVFTELPGGTISLITGWMFVAGGVLTLLIYRLHLRRYDQQVLKLTPDPIANLHAAVQHRISRIDHWGAFLTASLILYAILVLMYLGYQSVDRITQVVLRLLSLV